MLRVDVIDPEDLNQIFDKNIYTTDTTFQYQRELHEIFVLSRHGTKDGDSLPIADSRCILSLFIHFYSSIPVFIG